MARDAAADPGLRAAAESALSLVTNAALLLYNVLVLAHKGRRSALAPRLAIQLLRNASVHNLACRVGTADNLTLVCRNGDGEVHELAHDHPVTVATTERRCDRRHPQLHSIACVRDNSARAVPSRDDCCAGNVQGKHTRGRRFKRTGKSSSVCATKLATPIHEDRLKLSGP
eukprot:6195503-Pleurochrysis_carterae.AAC.3